VGNTGGGEGEREREGGGEEENKGVCVAHNGTIGKTSLQTNFCVSHAGAPRKPVFTFPLASQFIGLRAGRDFW